MTATVAGVYEGGRLELLEKPPGIRDGSVRVTIEQGPTSEVTSTPLDRKAFLRLPLAERRRILAEQADRLVSHYEQNTAWREWLAGDIVES